MTTKPGAVWRGLMACGALVLAVGCNEAKETGAVVSRSEGGTSQAPAAKEMEQRNLALVRAVNAIPDDDAVTIWAGDSAAFSDVGYGQSTAYRRITDNLFNFQIRAGGMEGEALAENRESLDDGAHYTIVALPSDKDGKRNLRVLKDDLEAVPPDKTRIRFVNGVPADEDVDLLIRGREDPLFDGVRFGTEAGWTELEPIVGTLVVRLDDRKSTLASLPDAKLSGGRSYTFVLAGRPGVQYELVKIEDVVGK